MKSIHKLKKIEYQEGAEKALHNSQKHYDASITLAKAKLYPFAITHLIISAEELTKAVVLKIKSIDNSINIPDIEKYFKSHNHKHNKLFQLSKLANEFNPPKKKDKKEQDLALLIVGLIIVVSAYFQHIKDKEKSEEELAIENADAIDSIEKIRISSIYVEFLYSRKWRMPFEEYTKENYESFESIYNQFIPKISDFIFKENLKIDIVKGFIN